jgi:hypothetical protein
MIHVDGFAGDRKGRIVSSDGAYERPVRVFFIAADKTLRVRAVLDAPGLKRVLDGRPTFHYVVVGAFDPFAPAGFMPVGASPGSPAEVPAP